MVFILCCILHLVWVRYSLCLGVWYCTCVPYLFFYDKACCFLIAEQGEGLQVLQYQVSEKYEAHYDYFHDSFNTKNGGQRLATVLMYL